MRPEFDVKLRFFHDSGDTTLKILIQTLRCTILFWVVRHDWLPHNTAIPAPSIKDVRLILTSPVCSQPITSIISMLIAAEIAHKGRESFAFTSKDLNFRPFGVVVHKCYEVLEALLSLFHLANIAMNELHWPSSGANMGCMLDLLQLLDSAG